MLEGGRLVAAIAVMAGITALLRFAPFLIFSGGKKTPEFVLYLGRVLPYAMIGMLVVYCLKGVSLVQNPHGLPEGIAIALVAGTYIWKRNTLVSVGLGTVVYMALVQSVF